MFARSALPAVTNQTAGPALGLLLILPLGCLLLGQLLLSVMEVLPVQHGILADPDSYMRLNRVLRLEQYGEWFDPRETRINPPEGHVQHWTRPLDLLLWIGAKLLQPQFGFALALHVWGVAFSPICLALSVVALDWACRPVLTRDERLLACLALVLQPIVVAYSSVGRADHHSLLMLLCIVLLGQAIRMLAPSPADFRGRLAGLIAATSLWVSTEAIVFVAAVMGALGSVWLLDRNHGARKSLEFSVATTVGLAVALLGERGFADLTAVENDRLSLVHLFMFGLIAVFWLIVGMLCGHASLQPERHPQARQSGLSRTFGLTATSVGSTDAWYRIGLTALGVVVFASTMAALFPKLISGPLGQIDPLYHRMRLQRIAEIQPLISPSWLAAGEYGKAAHRFVEMIGIAALAVPFTIACLLKRPAAAWRSWLPVAIGLAIYLPLACLQLRWTSYAEFLLVVPYAAAVVRGLDRLVNRIGPQFVMIVRPMAIVVALFWPPVLAQAFTNPVPDISDGICLVDELGPALVHAAAGRTKTILTLADNGPELLYRTPHNVLSIPNHRPQKGFTATFEALAATAEGEALGVIKRHHVDWILLCPGRIERDFFLVGGKSGPTLYERLIEGDLPHWVRLLKDGSLSSTARRALLFELMPTGSPAAGAAPNGNHEAIIRATSP